MKIEIKQGDCLELMKDIPDGSVEDAIMCGHIIQIYLADSQD